MMDDLSRYFPEILQLKLSTKAKALYVFIIDGDRGCGGQPMIEMAEEHAEYRGLQQRLLQFMARSLNRMQADWKMRVETPGETRVYWRGSVGDFVTDVAPLLTRVQRERLAAGLLEWRQDG